MIADNRTALDRALREAYEAEHTTNVHTGKEHWRDAIQQLFEEFDVIGQESFESTTDITLTVRWRSDYRDIYGASVRCEFGQGAPDTVAAEMEERASELTEPTSLSTYFDMITSDELRAQIESAFRVASGEDFEDGMDNSFAQYVQTTVMRFGDIALSEIAHFALHEEADPEVAAEALRTLGDFEHKVTYAYRRWLLEKALTTCSSLIVRDGANVGLAYMNDPHAIPYIQMAFQEATSELFRQVLAQTLAQLEET